MFSCGSTTTVFSLNTHFCCYYICSHSAAMEWISVSCGKSVKCVYEGSSLYFSPFHFTWFILLLFSASPCCTWTATSVWTCRQKKTSWFPPSETATTAAPSSGCSVTWPWASDPPLGPAAGAPVLHHPGSPHHPQVDVSACDIHLFLHQPGQETGIDATVGGAPSCGCFRS